MKNKIKLLSAALLVTLTLTYTSCKKSDTTAPDYTSQFSSASDDATRVSNETDAAVDDANTAVEAGPTSFNGGRTEGGLFCDARDSVDSVNHIIFLFYDGKSKTCDGRRVRSGEITIQLNNGPWRTKGASITLTFINFKVTRIWDNTGIVINGAKTWTNVSGGLIKDLVAGTVSSITHTVTTGSDGLSITFPDGSERSWQLAKQRVYTYSGGIGSETISGIGTDGTNSNLAVWGENRFGTNFSYQITTPLVFSKCSAGQLYYELMSGSVTFLRMQASLSVTYGLDVNGNPVTCPLQYYYKAVWVNAKGVTKSIILPY